MGDSLQPDVRRSRRAVLAAAAGGAAALAVTALRPSVVEAAPGNMQTETDNVTIAPTGVTNTTADSDALFGIASAGGIGVNGITDSGAGLNGLSVSGNGVQGRTDTGIGALGRSNDTTDPATNVRNAGVVGVAGHFAEIADNIGLTGVYGYSDPSSVDNFIGTGVWGDCSDYGVLGTGAIGVEGDGFYGAIGYTASAGGAGVLAASDPDIGTARALLVAGKAEFSRSGRATVKGGNAKKTVTLALCNANTLVLAVLADNRSGRWVRAVVPAAGQFTIYLNTSVGSDTDVTWIAFTNPSTHTG